MSQLLHRSEPNMGARTSLEDLQHKHDIHEEDTNRDEGVTGVRTQDINEASNRLATERTRH